MAVVMRMEWPEVTAEQYDEACEVVGWERDVPHGAIFHFCLPVADTTRRTDHPTNVG